MAIIIGVMLFFLVRFFTRSVLENNDKRHSPGIRISATLISGFISLLVLIAATVEPSKAGFISFMISLGVYLGFIVKSKDTKEDNLDTKQIEGPWTIEVNKKAKRVDEINNQFTPDTSLIISNKPLSPIETDNTAELNIPARIPFLQKINIFKSLSSKDFIIITTLIIFLFLFATIYLNRVYITSFFDKEKVNEELSKDRTFKKDNYIAKIKFENNRLYFNIEIYNKSFYRRSSETNIDIIFVDFNGFSLEKVGIKASEMIRNDNTYYYKDNLPTKPEIFLKIHNIEVTFTENRSNR